MTVLSRSKKAASMPPSWPVLSGVPTTRTRCRRRTLVSMSFGAAPNLLPPSRPLGNPPGSARFARLPRFSGPAPLGLVAASPVARPRRSPRLALPPETHSSRPVGVPTCSSRVGRPRAASVRPWWRPRSPSIWLGVTRRVRFSIDLGGDLPAVTRLSRARRSRPRRLAGGPGRRAHRRHRPTRTPGLARSAASSIGGRVRSTRARAPLLARMLAAEPRVVIADCGLVDPPGARATRPSPRRGRGRIDVVARDPTVLPGPPASGGARSPTDRRRPRRRGRTSHQVNRHRVGPQRAGRRPGPDVARRGPGRRRRAVGECPTPLTGTRPRRCRLTQSPWPDHRTRPTATTPWPEPFITPSCTTAVSGPSAPVPVPRTVVADVVRRQTPVVDAAAVDGAVDRVLARMTGLGALATAAGRSRRQRCHGERPWSSVDRTRRSSRGHDSRARPGDDRSPGRAGGRAARAAGRSLDSAGRRPPPRRVSGPRRDAADCRRRSDRHHSTLRRPAGAP